MVYRTTATATVVAGDARAELADEAKPLTAVIIGSGLAGHAVCVALRRVGAD
jgi:threonine dehydrogenase-like Zn-dependent dehydrogenase